MPNISNLEIFSVGTHNASTGTIVVEDGDLDQIVNAFTFLQNSNVVRPHLKLGHQEAQRFFGQTKGIPSLGWITRLWKSGGKLLADISDVPTVLIDLIKDKRFHNVSAEIIWGKDAVEHQGQKFSRVLSAVALLGVEMPAVKDLAGLANALMESGEPLPEFNNTVTNFQLAEGDIIMPDKKGSDKNDIAMFSQEQLDQLVEASNAKVVADVEAQFTAKLEDSAKELQVMEDRAKQAESEISAIKTEFADKEATTIVDAAIKDGKLLPKQRDFALAALNASDTKVKFGEDGEEKTMPEMFKEFLDAQGKVIDLSEQGSGKNKRVEFSTAAEEVDYKVKEVIQATSGKDKLEYAAAMDQVLAEDDDLRLRYSEARS
jgi:hypothetical protein